jgi:hypothetical protein
MIGFFLLTWKICTCHARPSNFFPTGNFCSVTLDKLDEQDLTLGYKLGNSDSVFALESR